LHKKNRPEADFENIDRMSGRSDTGFPNFVQAMVVADDSGESLELCEARLK
jgi:hypothetical protein